MVIENDIAWRSTPWWISCSASPWLSSLGQKTPVGRIEITHYLQRTLRANGGSDFFHQLALLGSIYGTIDLLVRPADASSQAGRSTRSSTEPAVPPLEIIEATRAHRRC